MLQDLSCPSCASSLIKKNGPTYYGKQNYSCKSGGRQFVENGQAWFGWRKRPAGGGSACLPCHWINSGPLCTIKKTSAGSGWRLTPLTARSWPFLLEDAVPKTPKNFMKISRRYSDKQPVSSPNIGKQTVLDPDQHWAVGQDSGLTAYVERFNCTLRQRAARLVRKTLSFSKSLTHHIGAIKYFICHYNKQLAAIHL